MTVRHYTGQFQDGQNVIFKLSKGDRLIMHIGGYVSKDFDCETLALDKVTPGETKSLINKACAAFGLPEFD